MPGPTAIAFHCNAPVLTEYDVVVCGGGPAGIPAGLGAARGGARVLLIEQTGQLGGVGTSAGVSHLLGGRTGDNRHTCVAGIFAEVVRELVVRGGAIDPAKALWRPYTPIPYRVMVPRPVRNVVCPGRAISVERDVLGPLREQAPCYAMGEAAGVAALQVLQRDVGFAAVDVPALRRDLAAAGALVDWPEVTEDKR